MSQGNIQWYEDHKVVFLCLDILYKLVVVCSTEKENHSRIVAALDKYRRPPLPLLSHKETVEYIKDKLTFNVKKPSTAADIDKYANSYSLIMTLERGTLASRRTNE